MSDFTRMDEVIELFNRANEDILAKLKKQEQEEAQKPKQLGSSRFMEVMTLAKKPEIININSISEIIPTSRLMEGEPKSLTRIVFVNGEDTTVIHDYNDVKALLKLYFK